MPANSSAIITACRSTAWSAIRQTDAIANAITPGKSDGRGFSLIALDPFADLFPYQPGRPPGHNGDDDGEGEDVFIGAGKRQQHGADGLQPGEQEAAKNGTIDAAETADDGGGKADDAEIKTNA